VQDVHDVQDVVDSVDFVLQKSTALSTRQWCVAGNFQKPKGGSLCANYDMLVILKDSVYKFIRG